jgi:predicted Rossmann fold nucleotide-binding protein DprA/Smf involved in DNA uptake
LNLPANSPELGLPHLPAACDQLPWCSDTDILSLGNLDLLRSKSLALFCSKKCPGSLIIQIHDLAHMIRDSGLTAIGGFHSPVEKECLSILLKGEQPLIICPARSLEGMRVPADWRDPMKAGRLLLLSPFGRKQRRTTVDLALKRNEFVAAVADTIIVAHASHGGATEQLCRKALSWKKRVITFKCRETLNLVQIGAEPVEQVPVDRLG